ncbi:aminotransferase class V-fold PLP-dependent enzyme [uncultured Croceitalea sp.]|uniref:aminotransferase class V-fold PLP-dependent enzyme n=1 Tax=uncultured Croceitalea sp. TaxID=1798908 RepID=UPI003306476C
MQHLRKKFPVVNHHIYANTAASGLLSDDLMEWRQEHDLDFLIGGSEVKGRANTMLSETRGVVADFFNCSKDNTVLIPNFTIGLNLLLEGLGQKEKVLLLEGDYPSLNWPFESRSFEIKYVPISKALETEIYEAVSENGITVLALSVVQWLNGIKIDLEFLKKLKVEFPNLLIIADGTQFLGTSDFDFSESAIDLLGASAYKWLLSGYGNGLMLIKEEAKKRFDLKSKGYGSGRNMVAYDNKRTFGKRLEPGHLDTLNFGSLQFSLDFLKKIGLNAIETHLQDLSKTAKANFMELGLLEGAVDARECHSTIFNIRADQKVFDKLSHENVVCAQRGDGIRLSFHIYNTIAEIEAVTNILKKLK